MNAIVYNEAHIRGIYEQLTKQGICSSVLDRTAIEELLLLRSPPSGVVARLLSEQHVCGVQEMYRTIQLIYGISKFPGFANQALSSQERAKAAMNKFFRTQNRLRTLKVQEIPLLQKVERAFYSASFGTTKIEEVVRLVELKAYGNERFTPGVTAETGNDYAEKVSFLRAFDCGEHVVPELQQMTALRHTLLVNSENPVLPGEMFEFVSTVPQTSQVAALVPKNNKEDRLIFAQPLLHIWRQIAIGDCLRDLLGNWQVTAKDFRGENVTPVPKKKRLNLSQNLLSQKENGIMALNLSKGDYKGFSLDLRGASDSISREWVKVNLPITYAILSGESGIGSRPGFDTLVYDSDFTALLELNLGVPRIEQLPFIAGMGNGWTFPLESMVFTFIGICAAIPTIGLVNLANNPQGQKVFGVYGDDIIYANDGTRLGANLQEFYKRYIQYLEGAGFEINAEKSSVNLEGQPFRVFESCGVFAYRGVDVRPIYLRSLLEPKANSMGVDTIYPFLNGIKAAQPQIFDNLQIDSTPNQLFINSQYGFAFVKEREFAEDAIYMLEKDEDEVCKLANVGALELGTIQATSNYERKLSGKGLFSGIFSSENAAEGDPLGFRAVGQGRLRREAIRKKKNSCVPTLSQGVIGTTRNGELANRVTMHIEKCSIVPYGLAIPERELQSILRGDGQDQENEDGVVESSVDRLEKLKRTLLK